MSKVLQERGFGSLPSSTKANPRDQVKSISTTIEADSYPIRRIGSSQYAVSTGQNRTLMYETRQMTIPFLSHLNGYYYEEKRDHMDHNSWKPTLKLHNPYPKKRKTQGVSLYLALLIMFALIMPLTVKYPKRIDENVLVGISKFTFLVDFIILDMPEDIKVPLILERPFLSTARAKIDVYKRKITLRVGEERIIFTSVKPASSLIKRVYMLSLRERMELDLEARLMGETLMLNRLLDPFFEDYIKLNDLNEPFDLRRNQGDDLMPTIEEVIENMDAYRDEGMGISTIMEGEVIEEFRTRDEDFDTGIDDYPRAVMNVPIFVRTFSIVTDFVVLENMDAYRDNGMGDVIVGEPFLREVGIKAKRF
ncbi:putative reverse transcriptase domain-containing protein [Tanacetum coccineum]